MNNDTRDLLARIEAMLTPLMLSPRPEIKAMVDEAFKLNDRKQTECRAFVLQMCDREPLLEDGKAEITNAVTSLIRTLNESARDVVTGMLPLGDDDPKFAIVKLDDLIMVCNGFAMLDFVLRNADHLIEEVDHGRTSKSEGPAG